MQRKNIIILSSLLVAILLGMLCLGMGLILAFVVSNKWLYLSLGGVLLITLAVSIIVFEVKRLKKAFRGKLSPDMQELLKRSKW